MSPSTKERLLDAAERLFSQNGYDTTSLRQIIAEAGVNLAAIHYHFGSKQELLDEIIARRVKPVNEERLRLLDLAEANRDSTVETVLLSFFEPVSEVACKHPQFLKLMGRIHAEGLLHGVVLRHFQPVLDRFVPALR